MKCERCDGTGKILGGRLYPGTHAYRPQLDCPVCGGSGEQPEPPKDPEQKYYRVTFDVIFPADGINHADMLGSQFVREALSSMQYDGSLPFGQIITVVRSPAVEEEGHEPSDDELAEGIDAPNWEP